ncbi:MAG: DUF4159 domain-containing protein [Planctomycetaceae bacterium]|jgi:hypothetical protein|nr:DUF4159 domain-containing protein [Planctomycetaceae bacterium]
MPHFTCSRPLILSIVLPLWGILLAAPSPAPAAELTAETVVRSIERARKFLGGVQQADGSWTSRTRASNPVGTTSLALLALLNSGMTAEDEPVRKALNFLRQLDALPNETYEVSLMISALATAKDGRRDRGRIQTLADKLQKGQVAVGNGAGLWDYSVGNGPGNGGDRSNGQFAILGLRDAVHAGIAVDRRTWERTRRHWERFQNGDGGWSYTGGGGQLGSTGSMTVAGIATLQITSGMLRDSRDLNPDGTPNCCAPADEDGRLERALTWLGRRFAVGHNPGSQSWLLYYLYGMERAGRLSGRRFFGNHDWYREGALFLVNGQNQRNGSWRAGGIENDPVIATSFALLFLSKGLAPVLINKLQFGNNDDWNHHRDDARNLVEHITGLPKWPKLMTWQVVDINKLTGDSGVRDLLQGSMQLMTGEDVPQLTDPQVKLLRTYLDQGGFLFAVNCCNGAGFHDGMFRLVERLYPAGEAKLKQLPPEHPVFRSEYLFTEAESIKLYGVDFGCRTVIIFTPEDLSCLWNKWMRQDPPGRPVPLKTMIIRALKLGVNVVAYATGREPPNKLDQQELADQSGQEDRIERGLLKLPKLRHTGGWNDAPLAIRNLLLALNRTVGLTASTRARELPATDPTLFRYPLVFMHGRNRFDFSDGERRQLRKYLDNGGLLFADAICGARPFDQSFRRLVAQLYPDVKLERVPVDHELFQLELGHDIRKVKRRVIPDGKGKESALATVVREGEPFLEGLRVDGRYVMIYSRYDISCALQRQASVACSGYVSKDAFRIAINVILYAMLQDVRFKDLLEDRRLALRRRPVVGRNP